MSRKKALARSPVTPTKASKDFRRPTASVASLEPHHLDQLLVERIDDRSGKAPTSFTVFKKATTSV